MKEVKITIDVVVNTTRDKEDLATEICDSIDELLQYKLGCEVLILHAK